MPTFSFQGVIHTTKTSPWNNSYRPKLCRLCCTLTTTKLPPPGAGFLGLQNYCVKIQKILTAHQFMCCFKKSKLMQGKCPKGCITWWQKKTCFGAAWQNVWGDSPPPKNFVSAHYGPTLIFQISSKSIQYWGKTLPQPSKVNAIHALWAYKYTTTQNEQKKLELGLVTFSNIWPGNGTGILSTK